MTLKLAQLLQAGAQGQRPRGLLAVADRARARRSSSHLARGESNKTIARALDISHDTVKLHVRHILAKLEPELARRGRGVRGAEPRRARPGPAPRRRRPTAVNKVAAKLKEELLALLPPTIFFIALHVVGLVGTLMTQGTGLPATSSAQIAVAALIIGKAVLLADLWPAINRFPDKPLAYNIAWKTVVYFCRGQPDPLPRAAGRFRPRGRRHRCRQPEAARRDRVAALLGDSDRPRRRDPPLLRDSRAGRALGEERAFLMFFRQRRPGG
ncbi:MAG: LuxR C-terminal-related transcriptional regulator [Chromatiales bacterium]|nr:LuxR C-terminal-related transcriptional regulator [Chromatiales bacterium]